jgi:hypothetical protein
LASQAILPPIFPVECWFKMITYLAPWNAVKIGSISHWFNHYVQEELGWRRLYEEFFSRKFEHPISDYKKAFKDACDYLCLDIAFREGTLKLINKFTPAEVPFSFIGHDDKVLIGEGGDLTLQEIDLKTKEVATSSVAVPKHSTGEALQSLIRFCFNGKVFFASKFMYKITIWDEDFTLVKYLEQNFDVRLLHFFENILVSFNQGRELKHWDLQKFECIKTYSLGQVNPASNVLISDEKLFTFLRGQFSIYDIKTGSLIKTFQVTFDVQGTWPWLCSLVFRSKALFRSQPKNSPPLAKLIDWETEEQWGVAAHADDIVNPHMSLSYSMSLVYKRHLIVGNQFFQPEQQPQYLWTIQIWKF